MVFAKQQGGLCEGVFAKRTLMGGSCKRTSHRGPPEGDPPTVEITPEVVLDGEDHAQVRNSLTGDLHTCTV